MVLEALGQKVLHYELRGVLGAGGMATLYRAFDTRLERPVALKFLPDGLLHDAMARKRMNLEAKAAAKLDHPHIGTTYSIEEANGRLFIVMALYEGMTLRARLEAGKVPYSEALEYIRQAALGLGHAHEAGIIHRDIKPDNLFITLEGQLKLLDFGIAKFTGLEGLTQTGATLGTFAYMAPEQMRGGKLDVRADLWSLGVVFYELLTGVSPFQATNLAATFRKVLSEDPPSVLSFAPDLAVGLETIIKRLLAKDAAARYASTAELLADFAALEAGTLRHIEVVAAYPSTLESNSLLVTPPHNLPPLTAPLVGRADELEVMRLHLEHPDCLILTVFGSGGTGKTRLATQMAHNALLSGAFPDGVYFVALDALHDAALIPAEIAATLGLKLPGADVTSLAAAIAEKRLLLVLDNHEHLMDGATLSAALVAGCEHLRLLVTSRERLNVNEEWVLPLLGLSVPLEETLLVEEALAYSAVQLFVQRAQRVRLGFTLDDKGVPHVLKVCRLVQGLPLAIELAAAWLRVLSCEEIAGEIEANLDFLTWSGRNTNARHSSIRAVFEYSWKLLSAFEQTTLAKLSVFRGGFKREAAREVAGTSLPLLTSLVDKSLLQLVAGGRYERHALLHGFMVEKLAQDPQTEAEVRARHGQYYLRFLSGLSLEGAKVRDSMSAIGADLGNIRNAWAYAIRVRDAVALREGAGKLKLFFDTSGRFSEGLELFSLALAALETQDSEEARASGYLLEAKAHCLFRLGRADEAAEVAKDALEGLRELRDPTGIRQALSTLANIGIRRGAYRETKAYLEEVLTLAKEQEVVGAVAAALQNLATVENQLGNLERAFAYYEETLELNRRLDNPAAMASSLNNYAYQLLSHGRLERAQALLEEGFTLAREANLKQVLPYLFSNVGNLAFLREDYLEAEKRWAEALNVAHENHEAWLEAHLLSSLGRAASRLEQDSLTCTRFAQALDIAWRIRSLQVVLRVLILYSEHRLKGSAADATFADTLTLAAEHPATERNDRSLARTLLEGLNVNPDGERDLETLVRHTQARLAAATKS